jgi:hypothetical protein
LLNDKAEEDEYGQQHVACMVVMHTEFWLKNLKERGNFKNPGCREEDNIKMGLKEIGCEDTVQFQVLVNTKIYLWAP